jgi:hypothetical protein
MPQRILRDWTDSAQIDLLSPDEEVLFTRLIMKADDYGNFHRNPKMVKSLLFPIKDGLRVSDIDRWLENLATTGMIRTYSHKGVPYLNIVNFGQRLRQRKRTYPEPVEFDDKTICQQLDGNLSASCLPEEKGREVETKGSELAQEMILEQVQLSEKLLVDVGFFQTLAMNWSIDRKGFESMVQAFEVNLNILNKRHPNYQEYKSHFFNWGVKKFQEYKSKPDRYASFRK